MAAFAGFEQFFVGHGLDLRAGERVVRGDTQAAADVDGYALGVAGENHRAHAVLVQFRDRGLGGRLRRIQEADETDQHHVALIVHAKMVNVMDLVLLRDGDHADAFEVVLGGQFLRAFDELGGNGLHLAVDLDEAADGGNVHSERERVYDNLRERGWKGTPER